MFEYIDQAAFNFYEVQTLRREAEGGWNEEPVSCCLRHSPREGGLGQV